MMGTHPCPYLEENTEPGFRWTCGLRRELGSWDAVLEDPRYKEVPGAYFKGTDCKVYTCKDCIDG